MAQFDSRSPKGRSTVLGALAALLVVIGIARFGREAAQPATIDEARVPAVAAAIAFPTVTEESEGCDPTYGGAPPPESGPGPCVGASGEPEDPYAMMDGSGDLTEQNPVPSAELDFAGTTEAATDVFSAVSERIGLQGFVEQASLYTTAIEGPSDRLRANVFRDTLNDGSVNAANRGLVWTEQDAYYPGVISQSDLIISRRYFSRLSFDGKGSVGAGWISTLYERVVEVDGGHLRHVDWNQPFNDPALYYEGSLVVEPEETSGAATTNSPSGPAQVPDTLYAGPEELGSNIIKTATGTYRLEYRDGRVHRFDTMGRVTSRTDAYGNVITFGYDSQGDLDSIIDSRGQAFTVTTDGQGYLATITNPLGDVLTYTNVNGYLTEVEWPATEVFVPAPDQESGTFVTKTTKRTYQTGAQSYRLEDIFDDAGVSVLHVDYETGTHEVKSQTTASSGAFVFTAAGVQVTQIDPAGWKTVYIHDSNKDVVEFRRYRANFLGHLARTNDQSVFDAWHVIRNSACACGRVDGLVEPDGGIITIAYDGDWNVTELRKEEPGNPNNAMVWTWGNYDAQGRAGWHVPPEGNAAANPAPYTITYTTVADPSPSNPGGTIETLSVPGQGWRTWSSEWFVRRDNRGRIAELLRPSPNFQDLGRYEKFDYWPTGGANSLMPKRRYERLDQSIYNDFVWDSAGRLLTITTHNGLASNSTYDARGRKRTWTSAAQPTAQQYQHIWDYDAAGNLAQIEYQYWSGQPGTPGVTSKWIRWNLAYDAAHRNWKIVKDVTASGDRAITLMGYDANGNINSYTDPDGNLSTAYYDHWQQAWHVSEGVGTSDAATRIISYTVDGDIEEIIEPLDATRSLTERFEYDGLDRNDAWEVVGRERREYIYNDKRLNAEVWRYGYKNGVKTLLTRQVIDYNDWHDNPTSIVEHVYDDLGLTVQRTTNRQVLYSSAGRPIVWSLNGVVEAQIEYESWGDIKRVSSSTGNEVTFQYGTNGWLQSQTTTHNDGAGGARQETKLYEVDLWGRYTKITRQSANEADRVSTYEYDSLDRPVSIVDEAGNRHRREYRLDGLLTRTVSLIAGGATPIERVTTWDRHPSGRPATVSDDRGGVVAFEYDSRGRPIKEYTPGSSNTLWEYSYNKHGALTASKTPTGRTIEIAYDNLARPLSRTITLPGQATPDLTNTYTYTAGGGIERVDRSDNGSNVYVSYRRDGDGRVVQEDQNGDVVLYARDDIGRVTDLTGPNGYAVHYGYDSLHRVSNVSIPLGGGSFHTLATNAWYGSGGALASRWHGDGTTLVVGRDGFSRPSSMATKREDGTTVLDLAYGWDQRSLVKYEHRLHEGKGDVFRYDAKRRLREVVRNSVDPVAEWQSPGTTVHELKREFQLDDDNHRIQVTTTPDGGFPAVEGYATDPARHHYTQVGGNVRTFSEDGNLETHGTRSFEYDSLDALTRVLDGGATVAEFTYDALGRRSTKTANGVTTRYVYAGPMILAEYRRVGSGAEVLEAFYYHGAKVDSAIMSRRRDRADVDQDGSATDFVDLYHHTNRVGSTLALTLDDGAAGAVVVETYEYDAFGEVAIRDVSGAVQTTSPTGNPILYTGREYDAETGLYHYRARTYDPKTGAFLQEDPLGISDDVNPVAYVLANPISYTDPYGTSVVGDIADDIITMIRDNPWVGSLITSIPIVAEIIELASAIAGIDYTSWLEGGAEGEPESMGWWDRISRGAQAAITLAGSALGALMKFKKVRNLLEKMGAKKGGGKLSEEFCFVRGTLIAALGGFLAIEDVALGMSVEAEPDPHGPSQAVLDLANPDAYAAIERGDWRLVEMEMPLSDGSKMQITLLRPATWLEKHHVVVGGAVAMSAVGSRKRGVARVGRVLPCPEIGAARSGESTVTGVYVTTNAEVLNLRVEGLDRPIGTTGPHPFWSLDREAWVPANCLTEGETIACQDGSRRVLSKIPAAERTTVFNIEVHRDHTYFVTTHKLWVHNDHTSAGGMQRKVERGQAPKGIDRFDGPHAGHQPEPHVHFDDGTSMTVSGKPGHKGAGLPSPTKKQREFLEENGWAGTPVVEDGD
ncbi:MAG: polymorphic toxin-type HINT domain-containing protein [bacterium]|nr:polymorphic toxin-type HINT domain-containing protein [bacterium]